MKYTRLMMFLFLLPSLFGVLKAQEVIPTSGGEASGDGGSVSYSVGQVMYTTNSGTTGSVSQGVQQSYEIMAETGIEEAEGITLVVSVYPNPTTDYLTLSFEEFDMSNLTYQLYDMNGMLLQNEKITDNQISIAMSNLGTGAYFLKVIQENKEVKIFKIIKK